MIPSVRRLADHLDRTWARAGRSPAAFPRLAAEALRETRLHESFRLDECLEALWTARRLPRQLSREEGFGQPPVTLARRKGLLVDLYFWRSPRTGIHSHGFRGAFTLLEGLSLQAEYRFRGPSRGEVRSGSLALKEARLLRPGQVEEISTALTHSVWHLSMPTLSLVARTTRRELQVTYLEPGLALERRDETDLGIKRRGILRTLQKTGRLEDDTLVSLLGRLAPGEAIHALHHYVQDTGDLARLERVLPRLPRLRPWRGPLLEALRHLRSEPGFTRTRDDDDRLLLALLASGVPRKTLLRVLAERRPGKDPAAGVLARLKALMGSGALPFRLNATGLEVLEGTLRGQPETVIARDLMARYRVKRPPLADVRRCVRELRASRLLRPLLG